MMRPTLLLLLFAYLLYGCTDEIDLNPAFDDPDLVVEAWLTDQSGPQTIILTLSQGYYDNRLPDAVDDARVTVCRTVADGTCFPFVYQDSGRYVWTPQPGQRIGEIGETFVLGIQRPDADYAATTTMARVPPIDSLVITYEEGDLFRDAGRYAELYVRDLPGTGDACLIRTILNGELNRDPSDVNLAFDGSFGPGTSADGLLFLAPIRQDVNPNGGLESGDSLTVEIWSLNQSAYFFLDLATQQIRNSDLGLFQTPVTNSPGNVIDLTAQRPVLGIFNVAAVSTASQKVE